VGKPLSRGDVLRLLGEDKDTGRRARNPVPLVDPDEDEDEDEDE
jgi:hypothetical protein